MGKKELHIKLQKLKGFKDPKAELEQYRTPPELAASVLWKIHLKDVLRDKRIFDLGCGTGTLGIGAKLLGAEEVVCVDKDEEAIEIARKNARRAGVEIEFRVMDIEEVSGEGDIVVQNPPFGSQVKGSDRPFIKKSLELADVVYSFHMSKTDKFVRNYVKKCGGKVQDSEDVDFPLEKTMAWHKEAMKNIEVKLYRFEKK